jgi:hypothetical protein
LVFVTSQEVGIRVNEDPDRQHGHAQQNLGSRLMLAVEDLDMRVAFAGVHPTERHMELWTTPVEFGDELAYGVVHAGCPIPDPSLAEAGG